MKIILALALCFGIALGRLEVNVEDNEVYKVEKTGKCYHTTEMNEITAYFTEIVVVKMGTVNMNSMLNGFMYSQITDKKERKVMLNATVVDLPSGHEVQLNIWQFGLTQYILDTATNICTKAPLPEILIKMYMDPDNVTFLGNRRYGGKSDGMTAEAWAIRVEKDGQKGESVMTMSETSCTIHTSTARVEYPYGAMQYQVEFFGVKKKIEDPKVFDLPDSCKKLN